MATIDVTGGGAATTEPPKKEAPAKLELDATKDTLARGDKTSGLGRVFVQMDSNALADDVADLVLHGLRRDGAPAPWRIRIVEDAAMLTGSDVLALLEHQAAALESAIEAAVPAKEQTDTMTKGSAELATGSLRTIVGGAAAPAAAIALQGLGILTKLLAHEYQLSGREIAVEGLGFDLLVAQKLTGKHPEGVRLAIERLSSTDVTESAIFKELAALDERLRTDLVPLVSAKAAAAGAAAATVVALTATRDALQAQCTELIKVIDKGTAADVLKGVRDDLVSVRADLATTQETASETKAGYDALSALATEVTAFLTGAATPPASGGRAPLVEAARAEAFRADDAELVLYVRLLTGGMDEIVDLRIIKSDTWTGFAGAVAEFALLKGSTVVTCGTRSALEATTVPLHDIDKTKRRRIQYADVPDFTP